MAVRHFHNIFPLFRGPPFGVRAPFSGPAAPFMSPPITTTIELKLALGENDNGTNYLHVGMYEYTFSLKLGF